MVRTMDKSHAQSSSATVALRTCTFVLLAVCFAATVLQFTGDVLNTLVVLANEDTVSVTDPASQQSHIVLPQLDVSIGMSASCSGGTCEDRGAFSGPVSVLPTAESLSTILNASEALTSRFNDVRNQFVLGYDIGSECAASTATIRALSKLSLAAGIVALFFLVASVILAILLFALLARRDVLIGITSRSERRNSLIVGKSEILVDVVIRDIHQHLRYEKPFLLSQLLSMVLAVIFSTIAMAVALALVNANMKCGRSTCSAFTNAMKEFVKELSAHYTLLPEVPKYSCSSGTTIPLFIAAFVLAVVGLIMSCLLLIFGMRAGRRRSLMERLRCLMQQSKSLPVLAELESRQGVVARQGKQTDKISPVFTQASPVNSTIFTPNDALDGYAPGANGESPALGDTMQMESLSHFEPRTLGSGIQLLRRRRLNSPEAQQHGDDLDRIGHPLSRMGSQEYPTPDGALPLHVDTSQNVTIHSSREQRPTSRASARERLATPQLPSPAPSDNVHTSHGRTDRGSRPASRASPNALDMVPMPRVPPSTVDGPAPVERRRGGGDSPRTSRPMSRASARERLAKLEAAAPASAETAPSGGGSPNRESEPPARRGLRVSDVVPLPRDASSGTDALAPSDRQQSGGSSQRGSRPMSRAAAAQRLASRENAYPAHTHSSRSASPMT